MIEFQKSYKLSSRRIRSLKHKIHISKQVLLQNFAVMPLKSLLCQCASQRYTQILILPFLTGSVQIWPPQFQTRSPPTPVHSSFTSSIKLALLSASKTINIHKIFTEFSIFAVLTLTIYTTHSFSRVNGLFYIVFQYVIVYHTGESIEQKKYWDLISAMPQIPTNKISNTVHLIEKYWEL